MDLNIFSCRVLWRLNFFYFFCPSIISGNTDFNICVYLIHTWNFGKGICWCLIVADSFNLLFKFSILYICQYSFLCFMHSFIAFSYGKINSVWIMSVLVSYVLAFYSILSWYFFIIIIMKKILLPVIENV